jgi:hypothetical protein
MPHRFSFHELAQHLESNCHDHVQASTFPLLAVLLLVVAVVVEAAVLFRESLI